MSRLSHLYDRTVMWSRYIGRSPHGEPRYAAPTPLRCRYSSYTRQTRNAAGEVVLTSFQLVSDSALKVRDRVCFAAGVEYEVLQSAEARDMAGGQGWWEALL